MLDVRLDLTDGRSYDVTLGEVISDGGEGRVHAIAGLSGFCAKIYRRPETLPKLEKRLGILSQFGLGHWHVGSHPELAYPVGICRDAADRCVGFVMQRLFWPPRIPLLKVLQPSAAPRRQGLLTWQHCVHFAADLARVVGKLHEADVVVGDLCPDNIFVSLADARITLVDVDSFQLRGPAGDRHPTRMMRSDYSAPELAHQPAGTWRSHTSDLTPLGIVIAQILLDQVHPFGGHPTGDPPDVGDDLDAYCIAAGLSWITCPQDVDPPKDAPDARAILPPAIIDLMNRCFSTGATEPEKRPDAAEWVRELAKLANALQVCSVNPNHRFRSGPALCPWCERTAVIGRDPFPAPKRPVPVLDPWLADPQYAAGPGDEQAAWDRIEEIKRDNATVRGLVVEVVKGGLMLDIGVRAFLPASQIEIRRVAELHRYIDRELEATITTLDPAHHNVVLSRRALLEKERLALFGRLRVGQVHKGVVSSIVNFGAFVDLGGIDGLVHVSELSWKRVEHPSDILKVAQEVEVEVIEIDQQRVRVSLSLKATQKDPWHRFARTHTIDQIVLGRVTKLAPYGAFVRVADGVEGLVHVSELAEHRVDRAEQVVQVGDEILAMIINIDQERRRISLSIKQADAAFVDDERTFDPMRYGLRDKFDDHGNFVYPLGFDSQAGKWLPGYESEREAWEAKFDRAYTLWTAHAEQVRANRADGHSGQR